MREKDRSALFFISMWSGLNITVIVACVNILLAAAVIPLILSKGMNQQTYIALWCVGIFVLFLTAHSFLLKSFSGNFLFSKRQHFAMQPSPEKANFSFSPYLWKWTGIILLINVASVLAAKFLSFQQDWIAMLILECTFANYLILKSMFNSGDAIIVKNTNNNY